VRAPSSAGTQSDAPSPSVSLDRSPIFHPQPLDAHPPAVPVRSCRLPFTNTRPDTFTNSLNATFSIGGSGVQFDYGSQFASYEPNAIKIWARSTTTGSGVTINDLKIKTPGVTGETVFPGTVINVSQDLGPVFQEIIIAGVDFKSSPSGSVTLEGTVAMQFGNAPAPRGSSVQFHVIATHIPWVDLDVDSNNNGTIDLTNGRRGTDDPIEQAAPGKIIPVGGDRAEMLVTLPAPASRSGFAGRPFAVHSVF